ncbi:MAG TPA: CooT family nickel-binding protein [Caproiciproducens sp.]|nr:CooT family nickel-binding protein [Caproiciproducens sp.]
MCEANVYILNKDGQTSLLLDAVDKVIPMEADRIYLENIYGERKTVKARIKEMHLVDHRIILE